MESCWLVTWTTYGWWLPGDPRGFRTRRAREFVPPPSRYAGLGEPAYDPAAYAERWEQARRRTGGAVVLSASEQRLALTAIVAEIDRLPLVPQLIGLGQSHVHLVAQFGGLKIRPTVGRLKSHATRAIPNPGNRSRVWAEGCHMKSLADDESLRKAIDYVRRHAEEGFLIHQWRHLEG